MSVEIADIFADGSSTCCGGRVIDPSGENVEGVCCFCGEHCGIVKETVTDENGGHDESSS